MKDFRRRSSFSSHLTANARSHISPPLNRFIFSQFSAIMSFSNISAIPILSGYSHIISFSRQDEFLFKLQNSSKSLKSSTFGIYKILSFIILAGIG